MGPVIDASLYWIDEPAEIGFGRVCDYCVARGLESRFDYAGKEHAAFVTSSRRVPPSEKSRASRTPLPKIGVTYNWISPEARERGDHPSIGAYWDDDTLPDTPPNERQQQGLREYHFFTDLCRTLNPQYAELASEHDVHCAYDISHARRQYVPITMYCRNALLGNQAPAFWSTYAYSEVRRR